MEPTGKVKFRDFEHFIKDLEYNYPYKMNPMEFKFIMRDNLHYLKKEILDNLIVLSSDEKKPYLNRLKYELENHKQHVWANADTLEKWYKKYNSVKEDDDSFRRNFNPLYEILNSDPPKFEDRFEEGFNPDTDVIQNDFYNYYYGFYVNAAIEFIDQQLMQFEPKQPAEPINSKKDKSMQDQNQRMKTNLSVEQLAFILKLLSILKPEIFAVKTEADLLRWISANFSTKRSGEAGISINKLRILFNQPDANAAEFWEKHLHTMLAETRKLK